MTPIDRGEPSPFSAADAIRLGLIAPGDAATLEPLLRDCQQHQVQAGSVVIAGNSSNDTAFVLMGGRLSVVLQPDGGAEVGAVQVGELVGEVSALTGNSTSAWVVATEPSSLLRLERNTLLQLASRSHHFAYRLLLTVCGRLSSSNRVAQTSDAESKEFRHKAFFDPLTGLKNRAWLNEHLPDLLEAEQRRDSGLHLYMVDIDHFKRFNDTWGHAVGDAVLIEVGQALQAGTRPGDHVVRMGGEEILVVAGQLGSGKQAAALGERLRQAVESRQVAVAGHAQPLQVTVSIGVARFSPGESSDATLERADQALYRAKEGGRNRVELA